MTLKNYLQNYKTAIPALRLRLRGEKLRRRLSKRGIGCDIWVHFRSPQLAHRWSTAHHIAAGEISIGRLRALPDGQDTDGNVWLHPDWDNAAIPDDIPAKDIQQILQNAETLGPPRMVYAEEGYPLGDPRRTPNLDHVPVSAHIRGLALDMRIEWDKLGDPWGDAAKQLVTACGLHRPFPAEFWHFTLKE